MSTLQVVSDAILSRRQGVPTSESLLVGISGIDGSGKGHVTGLLVAELRRRGIHAVSINVDGWLELPSRRFDADRPAEYFYHHAIRFDEMFARLVLPLQRDRSIRVEIDFTEETAQEYQRRTEVYQDVEVILLEGIFLFKRAHRRYFHWKLWVECTFETALERALARKQEGLPPEATIQAYRTIYFPAQEIHFRLDEPREAADATWVNDPRLEK